MMKSYDLEEMAMNIGKMVHQGEVFHDQDKANDFYAYIDEFKMQCIMYRREIELERQKEEGIYG